MGEQFKVVPEALRRAQMAFDYAQQEWGILAESMRSEWLMGAGDLGLIGRVSGIVDVYNAVVAEMSSQVETGQVKLARTSDALREVASDYEAVDEEYYEKFGWIERDLDEVAPPPS